MTSQPSLYDAPLRGVWRVGALHPSDMTFGEAPNASFRIVLDTTWIECAYERWQVSRRPVSAWVAALIAATLIALILYFLVLIDQPAMNRALVSLVAGTCGAVCTAIAVLWIRRFVAQATAQNFRQSKDFETVHSVMFYRDEFVTLGPTGASARRWNSISSSRRFKDGILILPDPYHFHWLPWADLAAGAVDEVDAILKANVADYKEL